MRRTLSIVVAAVLAVLVGVTIFVATKGSSKKPLRVVHGVIGSEKKTFFDDQKVKDEFAKHGLDVQVDTAGSRAIATTIDLNKYDFAFPAGTPAALKILKARHLSTSYVPFFTPMAIATFTPIAKLLETEGIAHPHNGYWTLDMKGYLALVAKQRRWKDIPGNTSYPVDKFVLIKSTDVTTSNSAAMYAAIASYVDNGNSVLTSPSQVDRVLDQVSPLFLEQGYSEQSSAASFDDYLSIGIGAAPMVMIYEAQFVERAALHDGSIQPNMVLMYPSPDVESKHTLVPLTPVGDTVGQLLTTDPRLQQLAIVHGFRTSSPAAFNTFVADTHVVVQPEFLNVIDPPTYETLEKLIVSIGDALNRATDTTSTTATTKGTGNP